MQGLSPRLLQEALYVSGRVRGDEWLFSCEGLFLVGALCGVWRYVAGVRPCCRTFVVFLCGVGSGLLVFVPVAGIVNGVLVLPDRLFLPCVRGYFNGVFVNYDILQFRVSDFRGIEGNLIMVFRLGVEFSAVVAHFG